MKNYSLQEITLEKIARSIEECWTLEQLLSTGQFLALYYRRFDFRIELLQQEWTVDNRIREKMQLLTALEGAQSLVFNPQKPSLRRLETYLKTLSQKEFETLWTQLQIQLVGVGVVEMSLYPVICQLTATLQLLPQTLVKETA